MSQSPRVCPNCGTPIPAGQRFCNNCGTDMEKGHAAGAAGPASQYGGPQAQQPYAQAPQYGQQPYGQQPMQPYQQAPQKSSPIAEAFGALGLLFLMRRYRPGYRPARQSSGCCGCLIFLFIVLLFLGIPGYVYYKANPNFVHQIQTQFNNIHSNSNNNGGVPTTQPPITTANIGQTVNYAGVDVAIESVEQSTAFIDDNNTNTNGMIRVNLKESGGQKVGSYVYSDSARLVLPDGSVVAPTGEENDSGPQPGTSRTNWLDFPVPGSDKIDQLKLVLGTSKEAQISIPLTGKADLSAVQPKTVSPNTSTQFGGTSWTVVTATRSFSSAGQQAASGMVYVTVMVRVDNPSSTNFNAYYGDYIRLKAGSTTSALDSATNFPLNFPPNTSGTTGTLIFQVPQGVSSYTLILLDTPSTPYSQASANFQI